MRKYAIALTCLAAACVDRGEAVSMEGTAEVALEESDGVRLSGQQAFIELPRFEMIVSSDAVRTIIDGEESWRWTLESVATTVPTDSVPARSSIGPGTELNRGIVTEHYLTRESGVVEQRFVVHQPLPDGMPLEISGFVETDADVFEAHADGWVWRHDDGRAVAIGPAVAFDVDGDPLDVFFDVDHDGTYIRIEAAALAAADFPVTIDPAIGPDDLVLSDVGTRGSALTRANDAAVAYSASADAFLVVWSADDTNFGTADNELEIYGRWVRADSSADELPVSDTFRVSTQGTDGDAATDARQPDIVYAPEADQFLVVWSGDITPGSDEIYGQILDGSTGALVGTNQRISRQTVADGSVDCLAPAVAWNSTTGDYAVVWESDALSNGNQEIWGRGVATTGLAMGIDLRVSFIGTEATTAQDSTAPDVIFDPSTDLYITVWEGDAVLGDNQIHAVRLGATIGPYPDPAAISSMSPGDSSGDAFRPALAYNPTANQSLVTWFGNLAGGPRQVWGQVLDSAADEVGADFRVHDAWSVGLEASDVAVAYDSSDDEFLVTWEADDGASTQIGARPVDADGTLLGTVEQISALTVDLGVGDAFDPAVAYSPLVDEFLVAFEGDDSRGGHVDDEDEIFVQFYGDAEASDRDGDGVRDELDGCPDDRDKLEPGICGCGAADADSDRDGTLDCEDECPDDPSKTEAGVCGCGVSEADSDDDGTADCEDGCPDDRGKTEPGICGCGVSDADSDGDGTVDCEDGCPDDRGKTEPGVCGCGVPDTDTDEDGAADCVDVCPSDRFDDSDGDDVCDSVDNCPLTANPDQLDTDDDGLGDACDLCADGDEDTDGDEICDLDDVCPDIADPDQDDSDADGVGDACDPCPLDREDDVDADGLCADEDVCPDTFDPLQLDLDDDGVGDECDRDADGDDVPDDEDNCLRVPNSDQADSDGDGVGDACTDDRDGDDIPDDEDNCPDDPNGDQGDHDDDGVGDVCDADDDNDGIQDPSDNCPLDANDDQADSDDDGVGDVCDGDSDNDDVPDDEDNCVDTPNSAQTDTDDDGLGDACDDCPEEAGPESRNGCPAGSDVGRDVGPDVGADAGTDTSTDTSTDGPVADVRFDTPDDAAGDVRGVDGPLPVEAGGGCDCTSGEGPRGGMLLAIIVGLLLPIRSRRRRR